MILPVPFAVVAVLALVPVLLPLWRGGRDLRSRAIFDRAVYRDQLDELDRDVARGLITETEAQGARLEIQRRLLATETGEEATPARPSRNPAFAIALGFVVLAGSGVLYLRLGAPTVPDMPFASRPHDQGPAVAGDEGHQEMKQAAASLAAHLKEHPDDIRGWLLYARTEAMLSAWDKAAEAFQHAIQLGETGPEVEAGYGEMLVLQAGGLVTPAARDAFQAAVKADPKNEVARYYLALAVSQAGEPRTAISQFQALAADLPDDSNMRQVLARRIQDAATQAGVPVPQLVHGKPPAATPATDPMTATANMPEADRKAMIEGMVAKLAAHMAENPSDLDGWLRLGRAYTVLGQRDKAVEAYDHASALKPGDTEIKLLTVEAMLSGLSPADPFPARAIALLREVQLVSPEEPAVLWYLGLQAARDGNRDEARDYWTRLLAKLPAGRQADMVKSALEQVKGS